MPAFDAILRTSNYIGGTWRSGGALHAVHDKYDGRLLARVPLATPAEMDEAIAAAAAAGATLHDWSAGQRSAALETLATLLQAQEEAFAQLICAEAGKPISYARAEVSRGQLTLRTAAAEALRFGGEYVNIDYGAGAGRSAFVQRFPVGPVAAISPFNFPLNLALHKVAPALAVGCPVVLKPSPLAPLTALALAALAETAGFPPGALNVLLCENDVAERMVRDERLRMLSFTGSPQVGWHLKSLSGHKRVCLELGGNAAVLVDAGADLEDAARKTAIGTYLYAGQVCISTQRIFVHEAVLAPFTELLLHEIDALPSGDPRLDTTVNGPIISPEHLQRISSWVNEALDSGATLLQGGHSIDKRIYAPTLLTHTRGDMKVVAEEVFGPVATIEAVPDMAAGFRAINDSRFGLQAGVFTSDLAHMKQAHRQLEVGAVLINQVPGFRLDPMPYGGVKESGLGREGLRYAMEEMTEPRLLVF
ncbi:MAG: aldehyde dehydrogenase family protein [Bacteroidia bacterium]